MATGKRTFGRFGLLTLALLLLVAVSLSNVLLRGVRLDLTENSLYTLSPGTGKVLGNIAEPVNIYLFFSDRATTDIPLLRTHAGRVREMLQDFAARSGGKLVLKVVDPLPFSEEEDQAAAFGLRPINLGNNADPIYFGVAGSNSVGDTEIIPFLDPSKEAFLEYDLARLVYTLASTKKPVIALLSSLPMGGGFDPMTQQVQEPWVVAEQMRQLFEMRTIDASVASIEDDIKVLVIVHPKDLPATALYAIDQFVLRGGRALVFLDPHAEIDSGDPSNPAAAMAGKGSKLDPLLGTWGVRVDPDQIVGDDRYALQVNSGDGRPTRHLGIIGVDREGLAEDDVITGNLNVTNLAFAGHISRTEGATTELVPLLRSSDLAGLIATERLLFARDPELLRSDFKPTGERYLLAARITGKVKTAYPDGPPGSAGNGADRNAAQVMESEEPINVVLVADADLLADRLWVQTQIFFGQRINTAFANNGDLVINALDNLLGSGDLISIRSRATFSRPFLRVQDLRRAAESQFLATEQGLQDELRKTESKLGQLQASRTDQGGLLLSPAQQAEIERFQARRLEIRKELRRVKRGLDQSIERLGTVLKIINIGLVPTIIALAGLGLLALRRRRPAGAGGHR